MVLVLLAHRLGVLLVVLEGVHQIARVIGWACFVGGLFNLGQTSYLNVIVSPLLYNVFDTLNSRSI